MPALSRLQRRRPEEEPRSAQRSHLAYAKAYLERAAKVLCVGERTGSAHEPILSPIRGVPVATICDRRRRLKCGGIWCTATATASRRDRISEKARSDADASCTALRWLRQNFRLFD